VTRAAVLVSLVVAAGCSKPVAPTADQIYQELVASGCLAPDDTGPAAVAAEMALPDREAWLQCLFDGGAVSACGVPCDAASKQWP
jgi:hypothetical protein